MGMFYQKENICYVKLWLYLRQEYLCTESFDGAMSLTPVISSLWELWCLGQEYMCNVKLWYGYLERKSRWESWGGDVSSDQEELCCDLERNICVVWWGNVLTNLDKQYFVKSVAWIPTQTHIYDTYILLSKGVVCANCCFRALCLYVIYKVYRCGPGNICTVRAVIGVPYIEISELWELWSVCLTYIVIY